MMTRQMLIIPRLLLCLSAVAGCSGADRNGREDPFNGKSAESGNAASGEAGCNEPSEQAFAVNRPASMAKAWNIGSPDHGTYMVLHPSGSCESDCYHVKCLNWSVTGDMSRPASMINPWILTLNIEKMSLSFAFVAITEESMTEHYMGDYEDLYVWEPLGNDASRAVR
jgi:hypothetical protein